MTEQKNGRITYQDIYQMHSEVKDEISGCREDIAAIKTKQEDIAEDVSELKATVNSHTEKIGIIKGKIAVWGVIGGGAVSVAVFIIARLILG